MNKYAQPRILILLDESSSMLGDWQPGKAKNKVATDLILRLMDSIYAVNPNVEFSLRVFGSQYTVQDHNCTDTKSEVPFSKFNRTQMEFKLEDLHPLGVTAIAYSLSRAADEDLIDLNKNIYSIVLITDGGESCNGDICGVMQKLLREKIYFKPYILSLEDVSGLKEEYACMGNYLPVSMPKQIGTAIATIVDAYRPMLNMTRQEYTDLKINPPSTLGMHLPTVKKDSIVKTTPTITPPPVKKADTVVNKPTLPKSSHIVVADAPVLPPKVQLIKLGHSSLPRFKIISTSYKPMMINLEAPPVQLNEADYIPRKSVTLAKIAFSRPSKYKVTLPFNFAAPGISVNAPPPVQVNEADIVPRKSTALTKIAFSAIRRSKITPPGTYLPPKITVDAPALNITPPEPTRTPVKNEILLVVKPTRLRPIKMNAPNTYRPPSISLNAPPVQLPDIPREPIPVVTAPPVLRPTAPVVKETPAEPPTRTLPAKVTLPKLRFSKFKMHLLYGGTFFDAEVKIMKVPPAPAVKNIDLPATTPKNTSVTPAAPKAEIGEYTVSQEDNKTTTLEVYITNGKGKYYTTTPQLRLLEPGTNKETRRFYRTVDGSGNPDPIENITTGKYTLSVVGRGDVIYPVEIFPGKKNKVNLIIKGYSLYFVYEGAPDRPVTEFSALVEQRNMDAGKTVNQRCTEKLEYEPGNYHISINTLPEEVRNVDLGITGAVAITIPQPGFGNFTATGGANNVTLWRRKGDRYLQFYSLNLNDAKSKHLQLQPGEYQVHYNDGKTKFSSSEKSISFNILSLKETAVELN